MASRAWTAVAHNPSHLFRCQKCVVYCTLSICLKSPTANAGTGSDYQSGSTRGVGATGTGSNYDTGSNQGTALTSGNVRSHIPGEQGSDRRGQQVIVRSLCPFVPFTIVYSSAAAHIVLAHTPHIAC